MFHIKNIRNEIKKQSVTTNNNINYIWKYDKTKVTVEGDRLEVSNIVFGEHGFKPHRKLTSHQNQIFPLHQSTLW